MTRRCSDASYTKALLRRAKAYTAAERHQDAVYDYEAANKLEPSASTQQALRQVKR